MMDWKETAWLWFTRAAQFWLVQTLIIYLWGCVVASKPWAEGLRELHLSRDPVESEPARRSGAAESGGVDLWKKKLTLRFTGMTAEVRK